MWTGNPYLPKTENFSIPQGQYFRGLPMKTLPRHLKILVDAFNNRHIFLIVEDPVDEDTVISKSKFPENV
jgi:hypothetical protein